MTGSRYADRIQKGGVSKCNFLLMCSCIVCAFTHAYKKIACQGILKYCPRDMLGDRQRETLCFFLDAITEVVYGCRKREALGELLSKVYLALCSSSP
jgi:hypothetical protein